MQQEGLHCGPMPRHIPGSNVLTFQEKQFFVMNPSHGLQSSLSIHQIHPWQLSRRSPTLSLALSFPIVNRNGTCLESMRPVQLNRWSSLLTPRMVPNCDGMFSYMYLVKGDFLLSLSVVLTTIEMGLFRLAEEVMLGPMVSRLWWLLLTTVGAVAPCRRRRRPKKRSSTFLFVHGKVGKSVWEETIKGEPVLLLVGRVGRKWEWEPFDSHIRRYG
jgi:hypothetical protein